MDANPDSAGGLIPTRQISDWGDFVADEESTKDHDQPLDEADDVLIDGHSECIGSSNGGGYQTSEGGDDYGGFFTHWLPLIEGSFQILSGQVQVRRRSIYAARTSGPRMFRCNGPSQWAQ